MTPMTDHDRSIQRLLRTARSCSRPAAAAEQFASVAEKAESYYGPDHEETLNIRDFWAKSLNDAEEHTAAIACNEENLRRRLRSKSFGKNHESTLDIRRALALSYEDTNQEKKAVEQYRELIKREEEQIDHTDLFDDVCAVSSLLVDWGQETGNRDKYTEANKIATKYLEMAGKELPQDHETLLDLTYNVGFQLGLLEKHAEAIEQFKDVIKKIAATEPTDKNMELLEKCQSQYSHCLQKLKKKESNSNERNPVNDRQGVIKPPRLEVSKPKTSYDRPKSKANEVKANDRASTSTEIPHKEHITRTRTSSSRSQSESSKNSLHSRPNSRQGHTRSNSESTVDKDISNHKLKAETTTRSKPSPLVVPKLLEPAKTIKRPRSASTTASRCPAEPFLRPASAASFLEPVEENASPNSDRSALNPVHSDKSRQNSPQTLEVIKADKRSSSARSMASRHATRARWGEQLLEANARNESEEWFTHLQQNAHRFLEKYHRHENRVRIALLDTGVALKNPSALEMSAEIQMSLCAQVGGGTRLRNQLPPDKDIDGHGSECAYLLTRVCPFAQILSYRIVETGIHDIDPEIVEEALRNAIDRQVHIISMSFGCTPTTKIRNLLNEARGKGILMFAATSNDGGMIKFPASCDEVFAIDAAKRTGGLSSDNPAATELKPQRFTALGEILSLRGSIHGDARRPEPKTGSSFATPIAAATAAGILEFANQPPLAYDPMAIKGLKRQEGMRAVLLQLFSKKKSIHADFNHINIEHFLPMNDKEHWNEGGDCDDLNSDRYQAADMICNVLKAALGADYGKVMRERILAQWRKESEEERAREREKERKLRERERREREEAQKKRREEIKKALENVMDMVQNHGTESA
ncbi:hypothetical protein IWZ01DRAFT_491739 [Phyllosticta capitalensis]